MRFRVEFRETTVVISVALPEKRGFCGDAVENRIDMRAVSYSMMVMTTMTVQVLPLLV